MDSKILEIIKDKYPFSNICSLAQELNLSIYQFRKIVLKHKVTKSKSFIREHGCKSQANYRARKIKILAPLDFKYFDHYEAPCIKSPSNPLYSHYHTLYYMDERNQI